MAIPKTRKPLAERPNRSAIEQAFRIAGTMQTPGVSPSEGAALRPEAPAPVLPESHRVAKSPALQMPPPPPPQVPVPVPAPAAVLPPAPPVRPDPAHLPVPETAAPLPAPEPRRLGRKPLKEGRTERVGAWISEQNRDRLRHAMYGESIKTKGRIDQSLIIEEALEAWLDAHGY